MQNIDFTFNISSLKEIASGGEGRILEHPTKKDLVIKYYHTPKNLSYAKHLESLFILNDKFLKPLNYYTHNNKIVGFEMRYVNFSDYYLFNNLFNKGFCQTNKITYDFKIKILTNLKKEIESLHNLNLVIGDLNQYNLFFSKKGDILFVDVDSYQSQYSSHSGILLDEIRDWINPIISNITDSWSFDILTFWALTYCHPFKWVKVGNSDSLEVRVRKNQSFLNTPDIKIPKLYESLNKMLENQFRDIFGGRRVMVDFDNSYQHLTIQLPQTITSQSLIFREVLSNVQDIVGNNNFVSAQIDDRLWVELNCSVKGMCLQETQIKCNKLYLANNKEKVFLDNTLLYGKNKNYLVDNSLIHYYDGSLTVINQIQDLMYNFEIKMQLGEINHTTTSVFAKSIILRDVLIQNFGSKKYIIVSIGNRSQLIPIEFTTKNAYITGDYYCVEYVNNGKTKFKIVNWKTNKEFEIDHYSYFTTIGDVVLIPDDEFIGVYTNNILINKLDINVCSKSSKLIYTHAGILLLENNKLYLLNTK